MGAGIDRESAEIGPRGSVLHDAEDDARGRSRSRSGDRHLGAIPLPEVLPHRRHEVPQGRRAMAARALLFHRRDDLGVHSQASVDREPARELWCRHVPEADAAKYSVACGAQDDPGRLDRIVRNLQGTGKDIGAAAGNHAERRHFSSGAVAQNPVENFVDDTVSTESDHSVEAVVDGPVPEIYSVAAMSGEGDFQIQFMRQRLHDHIGSSGRRGCGAWVDDQERPHGREPMLADVPKPTQPLLTVLAAIAAAEGIVLVGYAIYDVIQGIRVGLTGPPEVSNLPALVLQVVIFAALGVGLIAIARGWWLSKYGARAPFILAQLLGLVVGIPLIAAPDAGTRVVGAALVAAAVVGIAVSFLPRVTRAIVDSN